MRKHHSDRQVREACAVEGAGQVFVCGEDKGTFIKDRVSIPHHGKGRGPCVSVCAYAFVFAREYAGEHVCAGAHICACVKTRE